MDLASNDMWFDSRYQTGFLLKENSKWSSYLLVLSKYKNRINADQIDSIDWIVQGKAMTSSKQGRQQWILKFPSGWCATGNMMRVWGIE